MFFDKIGKIEKNYVERVENINIKVYTTNCVDNMQIDHLREWFLNPFFSLYRKVRLWLLSKRKIAHIKVGRANR